jgi:peptide/nickel transport system substrate-binding protein
MATFGRRSRDIQVLAIHEVPYLPTGQCFSRTAYRGDLRDIVTDLSVLRNVRREP